jgi:hypothetical protein
MLDCLAFADIPEAPNTWRFDRASASLGGVTTTRIAIDPGKRGAIALLDGATLIDVVDMPLKQTVGEPSFKFGANGEPVYKQQIIEHVCEEGVSSLFRHWASQYDAEECWCEQITIRRPKGKPISGHAAFEMGLNVGIIRTAWAALNFGPVKEVPSAVWKAKLKVTADKATSLAKARELWPDHAGTHFRRKMDDGRAEAALIGIYAHLTCAIIK